MNYIYIEEIELRMGEEWRREWDQMGILHDYEDLVRKLTGRF